MRIFVGYLIWYVSWPFVRLAWPLKMLYVRFQGGKFKKNAAINKAKRRHRKSNIDPKKRKRYRVFFIGQKYRVYNRDDIQKAKHRKKFGWHVNCSNMQAFCEFDTNNITSKI